MTYAGKFPMLNKNKAFGLAYIAGEHTYGVFPCQMITCSDCKFKEDVDSELTLTCKGARSRWLMSESEDTTLPKIISAEKIEDVFSIYPPTYSEPIKIEDESATYLDLYPEAEIEMDTSKIWTTPTADELVNALKVIKSCCVAYDDCEMCPLYDSGMECCSFICTLTPFEWEPQVFIKL